MQRFDNHHPEIAPAIDLSEYPGGQVKRLEDHWEVMTQEQSGKAELNTFRQVVCTLPAHQLSEIDWIGLDHCRGNDDLTNSTHFPQHWFSWV